MDKKQYAVLKNVSVQKYSALLLIIKGKGLKACSHHHLKQRKFVVKQMQFSRIAGICGGGLSDEVH